MPCFSPKFVEGIMNPVTGKLNMKFNSKNVESTVKAYYIDGNSSTVTRKFGTMAIDCSNCMGCRLKKSRDIATRIMHETQMWESNSFITLTYADEHLPSDFGLVKRDFQLFMKRLREQDDYWRKKEGLPPSPIRAYYVGEYGENRNGLYGVGPLGRPHYHAILFNHEFADKVYWKTVSQNPYYTSDVLRDVWGMGHAVVGDVTYESAAYVARYCTKKIVGKLADSHYERMNSSTGEIWTVSKEFAEPPRGKEFGGLGRPWFDKFGMTDVYPRDECPITRKGIHSLVRPPKYYDRLLEKRDPELLLALKAKRAAARIAKEDLNPKEFTYLRLLDQQKCAVRRFTKLVRVLETAYA